MTRDLGLLIQELRDSAQPTAKRIADVQDVDRSVDNVKNELGKVVRIDTVSEPGRCKSVLLQSVRIATA